MYFPCHAEISVDQTLQLLALRCPNGVACLLTALQFHAMTTQLSHEICLGEIEAYRGRSEIELQFILIRYDPLKAVQWKAFFRKTGFREVPVDFATVVLCIRTFLFPVISASGKQFLRWKAGVGWEESKK